MDKSITPQTACEKVTLKGALEYLGVTAPTFKKLRVKYKINPDDDDLFVMTDLINIKEKRDEALAVREEKRKNKTPRRNKLGRPIVRV